MTTQYSGDPSNVSNSLTRAISGAANNGSGLIRITTSSSHLFSSHDVVVITGVTGTTEANGTWSILVIGSTTFDLVSSTFTNAYVSGGSAVDHSLTPAATLPSDGEQATAEVVLAALQVVLDRTQFLATLPLVATTIAIPPVPFNISYGNNWSIGDNGSGSSAGSRVVKKVNDDNALIFDVTAFVTPHAGQRIISVSATFNVGQSHAAVPGILPDMRLYRTPSLSSVGAAPAADESLLSTTDAFFPTPGSGAAYYASGNVQTWTLTADQNNVIDAARRYYIALIDESGSGSHTLNQYFGFRLTVS